MKLYSGTSGYSYKEWRGSFYDEATRPDAMLAEYSRKLPAVELNNTFYRMPKRAVVEGWRTQVPESFRFAIKASQRITHRQRLKGTEESLAFLFGALRALGPTLGPVLFQLPPYLKKDLPLLTEFLATLPDDIHPAFEFRHPSWFEDQVYDALKKRNAALCSGDAPDSGRRSEPPLTPTASWGYLRLRREGSAYTDEELDNWYERIAAQGFSEVYVFAKHEALGPQIAAGLQRRSVGP